MIGSFLAQWEDAFDHFSVLDESSPGTTCSDRPENSALYLSKPQLATAFITTGKVGPFVRDQHIQL